MAPVSRGRHPFRTVSAEEGPRVGIVSCEEENRRLEAEVSQLKNERDKQGAELFHKTKTWETERARLEGELAQSKAKSRKTYSGMRLEDAVLQQTKDAKM
jgi:hypothetical protein